MKRECTMAAAQQERRKSRRDVERLAVQRLIKSEDGKYLVSYLADLALRNLGVPCKDPYEYAYNEGKRSVFLAILQLSEQEVGSYIWDLVKRDSWYS